MKISINAKTVDEIIRKQKDAVYATGLYLSSELKKKVSRDLGQQAESITVDKRNGGYTVFVGTNVVQAWIEEYGRKGGGYPGKKMLDGLVGWAGRHGFHRGRKTASYDSLKSKDKSKVWLLARSIAKKGIKAKETYTKTREKEIENMKKKFYEKAKL